MWQVSFFCKYKKLLQYIGLQILGYFGLELILGELKFINKELIITDIALKQPNSIQSQLTETPVDKLRATVARKTLLK